MEEQTAEERQLAVIAQYRSLVMKLAWMYWRSLPASVKTWVDPDDLIEDAYVFVVSAAAKMYDPKRGAQSTFIWNSVSHLLLNFARLQHRKKRLGASVPLEGILNLLVAESDGISEVEIKSCLDSAYDQASQKLREEMNTWFVTQEIKVKWSKEAKRLYNEFKRVAGRNRLTPQDCRRMMRAGSWHR